MPPPATRSCLYRGRVMHARLRPFHHRFVYRVFSLLLDIDEAPALARRLRLFSHNRWNLFSFHDRDHGPRDGGPLRPWIEEHLARAGVDIDGGPVRLLCFPRVLGYVFNPLSIWFCHRPGGELAAILYEVRNTFGDAHGYLIPVDTARSDGVIVQSCDKGFHVSPFIEMTGAYDFRLRAPDERLSILIRHHVPEGDLLVARHAGSRAPLRDATLARLFFAYPLMTLKVIAAIHWEALRLWRKGATYVPRPAPPDSDVRAVLPPASHVAE
ncbi:MAG: DUF1365 domain-containing protein [Caulobacterales bacterium]|nr:DUF1365 domain-containing protein [Caulobacterales bacterium]